MDSLNGCDRLESLDLTENKLTAIDLSGLAGHPNLKTINMIQNMLTDLDFNSLGNIPHLESLYFYNNQLETVNLEPLSKLRRLMNLNIGRNSLKIIDLVPLRHIKTLRTLSCSANKLESIELEPLSGLHSLEKLDFSSNRLRKIDLSPLANCKLMRELKLNHNQLQEIDITPLFHCDNFQLLSIDNDVMLQASAKYASFRPMPKWVQRFLGNIKFVDTLVQESTYEKESVSRKQTFFYINPLDFGGLMYDLVEEINNAFSAGCYVCTAFLSRKLLENLVISILQRKFGKNDSGLYLYKDRRGEYRSKSFSELLTNFWIAFPDEIIKFSPTTNRKKTDKLKADLEKLKNDFNVDVHHLGSFTDRDSLLDIRKNLNNLIKFLNHIEKQIN